jgi:ribosomal protein S30
MEGKASATPYFKAKKVKNYQPHSKSSSLFGTRIEIIWI